MRGGGGDLITNAEVRSISRSNGSIHLETTAGDLSAKSIINCAGLHADKVAGLMGVDIGVRIIPFRGEYFSIRPRTRQSREGSGLPGARFHFALPGSPLLTKRINGSVEAGPNAVLALKREGYSKTSFALGDALGTLTYPGFWKMSAKYWQTGMNEQYRSMVKSVFVKSLQTLVPEIRGEDLYAPGAGVRAQAVDRNGGLLQDFSIAETEGAIHVLNAPVSGRDLVAVDQPVHRGHCQAVFWAAMISSLPRKRESSILSGELLSGFPLSRE